MIHIQHGSIGFFDMLSGVEEDRVVDDECSEEVVSQCVRGGEVRVQVVFDGEVFSLKW